MDAHDIKKGQGSLAFSLIAIAADTETADTYRACRRDRAEWRCLQVSPPAPVTCWWTLVREMTPLPQPLPRQRCIDPQRATLEETRENNVSYHYSLVNGIRAVCIFPSALHGRRQGPPTCTDKSAFSFFPTMIKSVIQRTSLNLNVYKHRPRVVLCPEPYQ